MEEWNYKSVILKPLSYSTFLFTKNIIYFFQMALSSS